MKLTILVPVYNEEKTISLVLEKLLSLKIGKWHLEIVVINDCSTDKTLKILENYRRRKKIFAVSHTKNLGKTAAIKTGIKHATGDYLIIQDGDLEYNPLDIPNMLKLAEANPGAVIYGSRFRGKHVDTVFGHKTGNLILTKLTNLLFGSKLTDMETCYKLIPLKYFKKITINTSRFGFEPEVSAKFLRLGIKILEVPISYSKRTVTEGKSIRWWKDGWATVWILCRYRFTENS